MGTVVKISEGSDSQRDRETKWLENPSKNTATRPAVGENRALAER